jgi:hypothetical protein
MSIFRKLFILAFFLVFISITYILVYLTIKSVILTFKLAKLTIRLALKAVGYLFISLFYAVKLTIIIMKGIMKVLFWAPKMTFRSVTHGRSLRAYS